MADPIETDFETVEPAPAARPRQRRDRACLVVLRCPSDPSLVGSVLCDARADRWLIGRGRTRSSDRAPRAWPVRQRPGRVEALGALAVASLSRQQVLVEVRGRRLHLENIGRAAMRIAGQVRTEATVAPGDLVVLEGCLSLLVAERPTPHLLPPPPGVDLPDHPFGEPDGDGLVGESPAVWRLREQIAFVAGRSDHVLLLGPSGAGKELVAGALARRAGGPFVSRNAATLPEGLVDAELFGNLRNYPNPGMAARDGMVGAADGGTLFLDEIGEMREDVQAHLLRVLDSGEYHRLGDDRARTSRFRLIAATNRAPEELKHDVVARFRHRIAVPGLDARREDVPLLVRGLYQRITAKDPWVRERFGDGRIHGELLDRLVTHGYRTHVRELESLLWDSMMHSRGDVVEHLPAALDALPAAPGTTDPQALTPDAIRAALGASDGNVSAAATQLGLNSRYQLIRLLKKHGIGRDGA